MNVKDTLIGVLLISYLLVCLPCWSQTQDVADTAVKSINALDGKQGQSANSLSISADYSLINDQIDQAILLSRRAVNRSPDDIEAHQSYAEALERKIHTLKQADVEIIRECVSQWLIIFRNEVGEEKGLGFHGISILGHLYEDDTHSITARHKLVSIAGRAPKLWETNARYLKSVLRHASVSGKVVSKPVSQASQ